MQILSVTTVNVFSLAYFTIRIQYVTRITYKTHVNPHVSVRLLVLSSYVLG